MLSLGNGFEAAEADFNNAVELKAENPNVLSARGLFRAIREHAEQAAADFHVALNSVHEEANQHRTYARAWLVAGLQLIEAE